MTVYQHHVALTPVACLPRPPLEHFNFVTVHGV